MSSFIGFERHQYLIGTTLFVFCLFHSLYCLHSFYVLYFLEQTHKFQCRTRFSHIVRMKTLSQPFFINSWKTKHAKQEQNLNFTRNFVCQFMRHHNFNGIQIITIIIILLLMSWFISERKKIRKTEKILEHRKFCATTVNTHSVYWYVSYIFYCRTQSETCDRKTYIRTCCVRCKLIKHNVQVNYARMYHLIKVHKSNYHFVVSMYLRETCAHLCNDVIA